MIDMNKLNEALDRVDNLNKNIRILGYIARALKRDLCSREVELVQQRIILVLDRGGWADIPHETLIDSIELVDESILAVLSFRTESSFKC